jgi:hypothetical protein
MPHFALVGDSIFDNAAYTGGEPDVLHHLRDILPANWTTSCHAEDGATTAAVAEQVKRVPRHATHVAVAIGGNDVLEQMDLLATRVSSTADALRLFDRRVRAFESNYGEALSHVLALDRFVVLCTIYNGRLPDPDDAVIARVALSMFNDVIVRAALSHRLALVDLRLVCTRSEDYANPIEPSGRGGKKIALALADAVAAVEQGNGQADTSGPEGSAA